MENKMILGDCFEHLQKVESDSIDLILVDPPYLISRDSGFKKSGKETKEEVKKKYNISIDFGDWDKIEIDWSFLFSEWKRILKKSGTLLIFFDIWKISELKFYADTSRFKQGRICCWNKTNPVPINSKLNYLSNASEYFFTFVKGSKPTFNSEYDNGFYKFPICHGRERLEHPTQKPLALIRELVKKHSNIGDIILDCFAGTFTTAEACQLEGRSWIMIESDEKYFELGSSRINNLLEREYNK
jgi:site-specific DNA-methyltransferase (adenine-specific)